MNLLEEQPYNPSVGAIDDHLVDPPDRMKVMEDALFYGIKHIDEANPAGLNLSGQMISIVGAQKNRKTTIALNLVRNWCMSAGKLHGGTILWESLESGQTPRRIKQFLVCMQAAAIMARELWGSYYDAPKLKQGAYEYTDMAAVRDARDPSYSQVGPGNLFHLGVDFALSKERTPLQHKAIIEAVDVVNSWPLYITGAPSRQGRTKALDSPSNGKALHECDPYRRWLRFVEQANVKIIVVDHTNAYNGVGDYDRQQKGIVHASAAVSELEVVMLSICQPSLGSVRSGERMMSRGGSRYEEEAHLVIHTHYTNDAWRVKLKCGDARGAPFPTVWVPIEKSSGLLFPDSYPV